MQLPVHGKLCKDIGRISRCAGRHFLIDIVVAESHVVIRSVRLRKYRKIVVCYFCDRILALVDLMPDFMGNSPSKVRPACQPPVFIYRRLLCKNQILHGIPFDTNVVAARIHERSGEHLHIADVQMPGWDPVLLDHGCICPFRELVRQTFVLIEQFHHLIHRVHGVCHPSCLIPISKSGEDLRGRRGNHHMIQHNICCIVNAGLIVVRIQCEEEKLLSMVFVMVLFQLCAIRFQLFYIGAHKLLTFRLICHTVQVQHRNPCTAIDSDSVLLPGIVSGILYVESTAFFHIRGYNLRNGDDISPDVQIDRLRKLIGFSMLLRHNEL